MVVLRVYAPRAAHVAGSVLVMLGALVLWGWAQGSVALISLLPGLPAMMPNTAVGMLLLGAGTLAWQAEHKLGAYAGRVAAGAAALLGLGTAMQYVTGIDLGIDRLLFPGRTWIAPMHGRMSQATALSFTLAGCGLVLLYSDARRAVIAGQACALAVVVIAFASLLGYLFGAQPPARLAAFRSMALHTTMGFLVTAAAMLALRPSAGWMRDFTSPELGATVMRLLLPGAVLLPPIIAYFRFLGQQAGWYGLEFALALYLTVQALALVAGLWMVSRWLTRADEARAHVTRENQRLIGELLSAGGALESKVAQRTHELAESEAKFRNLLGLLTDWYWEQDESLRFTYVSEGYERLTELKAADSLGKTRFELDDLFESAEQRAQHQSDVAAHRPFRNLTLCRKTSQGEVRYLSVSGEPVFNAEGQLRGYRGVGRDVTI